MIIIKDLYKSAVDRLAHHLGPRIFLTMEESDIENNFNVELAPSAIVKAYCDHLIIDLGENKEYVDKHEFFRMEIE